MGEADQLATELYNSAFGDPWHGAPVAQVIGEVNVEQALHKPIASAHNIIELTLHMSAWTEEVLSRFENNTPGLPQMGDWPHPKGESEEYWGEVKQLFFQSTSKLIETIKHFPEAELDQKPVKERNTATGTGFSYRGLILGLVQHNAYHAGQISLLKKSLLQ